MGILSRIAQRLGDVGSVIKKKVTTAGQRIGNIITGANRPQPAVLPPVVIPKPVAIAQPSVFTKIPTPLLQGNVPVAAPAPISRGVTGAGVIPSAIPPKADVLGSISDSLGYTSGGDDYRSQMMDLITQMGKEQATYTKTLAEQPSASELYAKFSAEMGLPAKEASLGAITARVKQTEGLLDQLESDITARASAVTGGGIITEPMRRRLQATEQAPLVKQLASLEEAAGTEQAGVTSARESLANMVSMAQAEQQREAALAQAPMDFSAKMLPMLQDIMQYQSPEEKTYADILSQELKAQYAPPKYETVSAGGTLIDPATGRVIYHAPGGTGAGDELLSIADIAGLGGSLPYGTTKAQAIAQGIVPSKVSPVEQAQAKTILLQTSNAKNALARLKELGEELKPLAFGPLARVKGWTQNLMAKAGMGEAAEQFNSLRGIVKNVFSLAMVPGARGGLGMRYSAQEVENALPKIGDSAQEFEFKMQDLTDLVNSIEQTAQSVYGGAGITGGATGTGGSTSSGNTFNIGGY